MKKNYAFAFVAFVLLATSLVFAQNSETVEKMTGIRGVALRTYCSFSTLFGADNTKCFDAKKVSLGNTASVGAAGIGFGSETPSTPQAPAPTQTGNQGGQTATIGGFNVPVAPQIIERTVIVQGTPGLQGPAGRDGQSSMGAFTNVPQVFWNGGGGSGNAAPLFAPVSPLPGGALPGQVLTTNASGTVEWQYITLPSASGTPSIFGSLANIFAINGLNLATTSTSTTLKLGGSLTEDTTITQDTFNFGLTRGGFSILNQGSTTVPIAGGTQELSNFAGLKTTEGTHSLFAGFGRRIAPAFPLFEVQAFDSATNRQGYSAVGNSTAQMGVTNGTSTNQIRADFNRIRLSSNTNSGSSSQITVDGNGVSFGFDAQAAIGAKTYSFPRLDGAFDSFMTTNGVGQLGFRSLTQVLASSSTSTLSALPLWSTTGNVSTNPATNFLGTTDAQDLVMRTNNVERARIAANGNFTLFTNDQNASSSLTVKGIHSDGRWGIFDEANNKLIQNRADAGVLGFGTGDFVSYGFNSAMGIRGADVHIPHLVVGGNHTGPNNISQLRMESSSQTEYQYAGAYPNRVNSYILSTTLSAPLAPTDIRANMKIGARDLQFFTGANNSGIPALMVAENGNVGIGTTTPMRPLTVVGNVGGTLGLFQNTRPGAPAGISFLATRADSVPANRFGWFVNPNVSGEDRLAVHASGVGDLWSFSKNGDLVGSLGTSFNQINDVTPARLSVLANDTRPVALFQNGDQSYVQIKNGAGAFPQTYNVGVEAVGGTFNINDAAANQTRLSINRNGNVQIYNMLNVGSYGFGLGNTGDAGFGNSSAAYMRYVQRAHIGDGALELFDSSNQLSTVISQSAIGTATEFNKSQKDIDFRIAGTVDNNLFFADASANQVRVGTATGPANAKFTVFTDETLGDALFARQVGGGDRTLAFGRDGFRTNTTGTFGNSAWSGTAGLEVFGATPARTVFRVQGHSGQTSPLQEWRNGAGTDLAVVDANGNLGLGTILPSTRLEVNSGIANDSGFAFSQLNSASPALGTELKFLTVNALGKVILSGLDASVFAISSPAGVNGSVQFKKDGLFASNTNFNWDDINSRLGLGTNAPTEVLEVAGNIKLRTNDKIILENNTNSDWITSGPGYNGRSLQFWTASNKMLEIDSGTGSLLWNENGSGDKTFQIRPSNGQTSNVLVMKQNPNQGANTLFAVNGLGGGYFAGNVGIGTSTPRAKLDVDGDAWIGQVKISNSLAGFPSPTNAIEFFHGGNLGGGNYGTGVVAGGQTNGTRLLLSSANMDGSGQFDHGQLGRIWIRGVGQKMSFNAANAIAPTSPAFEWNVGDAQADAQNLTQYTRMVLTQDGRLGLGTSTPARKLHVAIITPGQVARFQNADGTCNINPSIFLAFNCLSDRSLKKDIAPLQSSLALFAQLNPVNYHWNTEDSSSPLQYGFIAQDIEAIFPSFVTTDSETGIKSVAFGNLIPVTIKAINEMNVHLGDLSKDTTPGVFAESTIFKRFTDAFKALTIAFKNITADKATVKELCLPKSDGTVICLSGDQVAAIVESAGVSVEPVVVETPKDDVVPVDPVGNIEPMPVEDAPTGDTLVDVSESPANEAPDVVIPVTETTPTSVVEVPVV